MFPTVLVQSLTVTLTNNIAIKLLRHTSTEPSPILTVAKQHMAMQ